jgi:putative transposase
MSTLIDEAAAVVGTREACAALGVCRATYFRAKQPVYSHPTRPRTGGRALSETERSAVLDVLHEPRFTDLPVPQVHAKLLDEGKYPCSLRTMYRILDAVGENRERRDIRRHANAIKPELLATRPNELWSWDITKLLGPQKWTYYYLYVIIDVFSRYVVGWMLATCESKQLARKLIAESCAKQRIEVGQLTLHADRGSSMTSKPVAQLLADLGVTKTHSRPYQSNDNPFSESHFKTFKYRPGFPNRFGCPEQGRSHCTDFFDWYNHEHQHSALAMLTPFDVHYGHVEERLAVRAATLQAAYERNPERFPHGVPEVKRPPTEVWINKPSNDDAQTAGD